MRKNYTDEDVRAAVASSLSIREVLGKLSLAQAGGNYATMRKIIKECGISAPHFKGRGWNKGRKFGPKRDINEYLSNENFIQSHKLKNRLIAEGFFERKCYSCNLSLWNNKPIPVEIEHKDGNHLNNNLTNLTILCPNCHAQTSTYRGKNKGKYKE